MKTAQKIKNKAKTASEAWDLCQKHHHTLDQKWVLGTTEVTFDDGSILVLEGMDFYTIDNK